MSVPTRCVARGAILRPGGIEPPTLGLGVPCSILLELRARDRPWLYADRDKEPPSTCAVSLLA